MIKYRIMTWIVIFLFVIEIGIKQIQWRSYIFLDSFDKILFKKCDDKFGNNIQIVIIQIGIAMGIKMGIWIGIWMVYIIKIWIIMGIRIIIMIEVVGILGIMIKNVVILRFVYIFQGIEKGVWNNNIINF